MVRSISERADETSQTTLTGGSTVLGLQSLADVKTLALNTSRLGRYLLLYVMAVDICVCINDTQTYL